MRNCLICLFPGDHPVEPLDLIHCHGNQYLYKGPVTYQSEAPDQRTHQDQQVILDLLVLLHQEVKNLQKTKGSQTETQELKKSPQRTGLDERPERPGLDPRVQV